MGQITGALRRRASQDFGPTCFIGTETVLTIKRTILFPGSLSLNICLGLPPVKSEQLLCAALSFPHKLAAGLGGGGVEGRDDCCQRIDSPNP